MHPTPWLQRQSANQAPRLRLYCFPYAGGHAGAYAGWQGRLPPEVEVCAAQLPGRAARFREAGFKALPPLVDALARELPLDDELPFAFFGHSMGGLIAFELARRLRAQGRPQPLRLIVSGCDAPQHRQPPRMLHRMDDDGFIDALRDYNGTPAEILAHREMMDLLLPTLRTDFELVETYRYQPAPPLALPITVLAGRGDRQRLPEQTEGWQRETAAPARVHWFDGDHFFIASARDAVLARLNSELADALSSPAAAMPDLA
ncbi:thioesterase II family protein [Chromobacterium sp. Beijing]|uniref:thioesterase II family protein n=1 Tax=Chromobacterium sp. Beijing TaxID=2735795 RepID=UPI001F4208D4|nr:alpha/beta fold hydrolase [Chromobacterium sp. Beijing]UJB32146.1 thioesterase [Chromobacterium sp. Beijing]